MVPEQTDPIRFRAYCLGGIVANFFLCVVSVPLLLFRSFYPSLLFFELILVGGKKIWLNGFPRKAGPIPNDGYVLQLLKRSAVERRDYATYLRLYRDLFRNDRVVPRDYMVDRADPDRPDEMLFYNEIRMLLADQEHERMSVGH